MNDKDAAREPAANHSRGYIMPAYLVADESRSMTSVVADLNAGLASLHEALLREPMAAAKVRLSILGFSDHVVVHTRLADVRELDHLPVLSTRGGTSYSAAFHELLKCIPTDVAALRRGRFGVYRPAVFFLTDGRPSDQRWQTVHRRLLDRARFPYAPNIISCGIGAADPAVIRLTASDVSFAFVAVSGADVGAQVSKFCAALARSLVYTGRAVAQGKAEVAMERPEGFRLAIDVV